MQFDSLGQEKESLFDLYMYVCMYSYMYGCSDVAPLPAKIGSRNKK